MQSHLANVIPFFSLRFLQLHHEAQSTPSAAPKGKTEEGRLTDSGPVWFCRRTIAMFIFTLKGVAPSYLRTHSKYCMAHVVAKVLNVAFLLWFICHVLTFSPSPSSRPRTASPGRTKVATRPSSAARTPRAPRGPFPMCPHGPRPRGSPRRSGAAWVSFGGGGIWYLQGSVSHSGLAGTHRQSASLDQLWVPEDRIGKLV